MFSSIIELIKLGLGFVKERSQAKHDRNMAAITEQKRQIEDRDNKTHAWDMAQLNDKDKALRIMAFILFISPGIGYIISPAVGDCIERFWTMIPQWQADVLSGMCLAVFGRQHIPNMLGAVISTISKAARK